MRFEQLFENKSYLYEGLDSSALRTVKLWESAGQKILEANLTADQIQQLFKSVEKDSTDAGGNRTLVGQGKDVAVEVNKAWKDLKDKVYNSKPMSNFAAEYDKAAEKLKQATGGDAGAMKYVQKYRDFATKHPILQSAIYSALIAAAGISGVGLGGAAALGLFKLVDQALQGKDIRDAMWGATKTAAMAYGAGQLFKALHGTPQPSSDGVSWTSNGHHFEYHLDHGKIAGDIVFDNQTINPSDPNYANMSKALMKYAADNGTSNINTYKAGAHAVGSIGDFSGFKESILRSKKLSVLEVRAVIGSVVLQEAGVWDTVKGAAGQVAGAVVDKAKTVGHNLTTKVTADKLQSAWKQAGSPTDSEAVANVLRQAGVGDDVINSTFASLQIPTSNTQTDAEVNPSVPPTDATQPTAKTSKVVGKRAAEQQIDQLVQAISSLKSNQRQSVVQYANQQIAGVIKQVESIDSEFYSKFLGQRI
jgi:hypothetical protein